MSDELNGKRIAFLVANEGVEQVELTEPAKAIREAGGEVDLIAPADEAGPGLQPPRQGRHLRARQDGRRGRRRPITTAWSCPAASPTPTSCARDRPRSSSCGPSSRPRSRSG